MMKSNIDLTENQMFSRQSFSMRGIIRASFWEEFPWSITRARTRMIRKEFEAIWTGDRQERESKKLCDEEMSRNYCDRCGAYLVSIPWSRTYGLCRRCQDELDRQLGTILTYPWGEEMSMQPNSTLLSLNW